MAISTSGRRRRRLVFAAVLSLAFAPAAAPSAAADDASARELYVKTCSKCHGLIQEDRQSWRPENLVQPAVTLPLGPTLSNVYMRPAGSIEGYHYSRAMRQVATGWVWGDDELDLWLTSTQDFLRGSTMWLRVDELTRREIIGYLKKYARYKPPQ